MSANNESGDSLGKLAARYESKAQATRNLAAGGVLVAVGVLIILLRNPIANAAMGGAAPDATPFAAVGVVTAIIGLAMVVLNALSRRMSFEVRANGVRFQSRREEVEIPWSEVSRVRVWETRILKQKLHVRTDWRIRIVGVEDTIELSGWFLGLVPSVPSLIAMIEVKSGIKFEQVIEEEDQRSRPADDEPMTAEELIRNAEGSRSRRRKRRE